MHFLLPSFPWLGRTGSRWTPRHARFISRHFLTSRSFRNFRVNWVFKGQLARGVTSSNLQRSFRILYVDTSPLWT